MLKLVASLRNSSSEDGLSSARQPMRIPAIPQSSGLESRDDSHGNLPSHPWRRPFRSLQDEEDYEGEDDDDDDDEIPGLIDEEPQALGEATATAPHEVRHHPWQRHPQVAPPSPKAPKEASDCGKNAVPFFVLDWMLEDLVPDDQDARTDLANLLNEQESKQQASSVNPFSPLRKTKSCVGMVGRSNGTTSSSIRGCSRSTRAPSPILRRLLPWSSSQSSSGDESSSGSDDDDDELSMVAASRRSHNTKSNSYRPASPVQTQSSETLLPMPITPKSSNRKKSKMRQKQNAETLLAPTTSRRRGGEQTESLSEDLLLPRNLNGSLEECECKAVHPNLEPEDAPPLKPERALSPSSWFRGGKDSPPPPPPPLPPPPQETQSKAPQEQQQQQNLLRTTKKSASCPRLYRGEEPDDSVRAVGLLKQRAKEQHDRRERRNKLTIVQRSLTLAQGWNNKGLTMAGRATRAEQFHQYQHPATVVSRESDGVVTTTTPPPNDAEAPFQQQQQQQQHFGGPEQWWESSLECWDNALEIYRSLLGEYHERVADVQNNRGIALGKLGRFEEALDALGMALEARKKQDERAKKQATEAKDDEKEEKDEQQQQQQQRSSPSSPPSTPASAAIVSTLHNIANVFRDAGNPTEALRVLVEAHATLLASEQDSDESNTTVAFHHKHHCWHQSARLSTAIGHVYYESESWKEAREAYGEALEVYDRLSKSLSKQSDRLGWGQHHQQQQHSQSDDSQRLELLHHRQLIHREVSILEKDLDELDRCQQARDGSRARLLQARRQQQQQQREQQQKQKLEASRRRPQQQQQQQQQEPQPQQTLFGIVSSLRT